VFFSGATDISANVVNNYSASFTTALNLTATPATLVATSPANGATGANAAPTTSVVDLQFSKPIDPCTVNPGSFYILKQDGLPAVTGTIQMLANNTVLRFIPGAPLQGTAGGSSIYYRVHYENTLHDSGGLPIAGSANNTTDFYVGTATDNTPPTVTSSAPDNGAAGVGDNATIRFTFSEPMDTLTINPTTVTLMNGATPIPFSLSFSGTAYTTVTLSPQVPLPDNATLTLALTSGITDPSNNALTPQSITFQTGNGADFSVPYVIYSSIDSNTPAVPANSSFTLIFNKPLDRNAVSTQVSNNGNYSVWAPGVGPIPTTITVSPDGQTVTFVPAPNLIPSHGYTLYAEYATDLNGNAQTNFAVNFTTSAGTDSTPPQVIGSNPAAGATGAPLNPSIEAQFNEAVSATSLSQITLMNGATSVPFTASLIYADSTVRLTPANLLLPNITYTVVVQGVQDVAGNTMAGSYTFSFTTGTNFDESATPNILSVIANGLPLSGANTNNIPDSPTVVISFDTPVEPASLTNNGGVQILLASNTSISYPLNIALSADRKTATVTLAPGTLAAATQYLIRVGYNYRIRDWAGNYNNGQYLSDPFTTL
jgi:hypothetical protein